MRKMIATGHSAPITDVAVDTAGRYVATCSEDRSICIHEMQDGKYTHVCTLERHEAGILRVAWGHTRFPGNLLASAGADGQLIIWKERAANTKQWTGVYSKFFGCPVQAVAWAPHEIGQVVACGCANGQMHVLSLCDDHWDDIVIDAHATSCNGVSWCPCLPPSTILTLPPSSPQPPTIPYPRLVSCGNERAVRIWRFASQDRQWIPEHELNDLGDTTCARDVTWAPNTGLPFAYIAAGSEEGRVVIWLQGGLDGRWKHVTLPKFDSSVCRLAWSTIGTYLSVACSNGKVTLWGETSTGMWEELSTLVAPKK